MNWERYQVEEFELRALIDHGYPISVTNANLMPNAGVELFTLTGSQYNAIYDPHIGAIRRLNGHNPHFKSMANRDLLLLNDHMLNSNVNTLIINGFFGTGKTSSVCSHLVPGLLKGAAGDSEGIPTAFISKPHVGIGSGYGYLPGDLHDKTAEEFKSYTQYFNRYGGPGTADWLMARSVEQQGKFVKQKAQELPEAVLNIMVFEYMRGLDIDSGWVVLDETQNTDKKEVSSLISRVGDDAKLILIGDTTATQIDKRGNSPTDNGLSYAKEIYQGKKYAAYVEMQTLKHILRGQRVRDLAAYLKVASQ